MTSGEKFLKKSFIAIIIISSLLLQVLIAGVPVVTASPESPSKGNANASQILPVVLPNNRSVTPPIHVRGGLNPLTPFPLGFSPSQIKTVYNLPSTGGSGTIAIIDVSDDPTVESDLNVSSTQFGLPLCTTANGCFEKHKMSPGIGINSLWTLEIALDTQWAHSIAPNAKILLVEANSNSDTDLLDAVDYARSRPDVVAISMSWGGSESPGDSNLDYHFTSSYGAIFFASSGDGGAGVNWPAVSSNVIGVGGTTLTLNSDGTVASETAWSGSGGGNSTYEPEPPYQVSYSVLNANGMRAVPDVSYNADPNPGVSVYDTFGYLGWLQVGGTSAGAPQWAAIQSLGHSTSNNNFYQDA
jgi:subtilase family serine protease